eukprot:TRINITY_DN34470_c0_g1_i1.p1 TRINITY_DN34470_c0_g1~~TRINITY_DN34470_c0_g1_i1.p1  ORF type:complete len:222 (-),score=32.54 TRINITY_DN34470_c0_g1_i1:849-1514(-)
MEATRGRSARSRPSTNGVIAVASSSASEDSACSSLRAEVERVLQRRQLSKAVGGMCAKFGSDAAWQRARDMKPAALLPNLILWRAPSDRSEVHMLMEMGVTHVVNCAQDDCDSGSLFPPQCEFLCLRARDTAEYDMIGYHLAEVEDFVDRAFTQRGSVVLVHCQHGQNRSAAVALGYMVHRQNMNLVELLEASLSLRPTILTNKSFVEQLVQLAVRSKSGS